MLLFQIENKSFDFYSGKRLFNNSLPLWYNVKNFDLIYNLICNVVCQCATDFIFSKHIFKVSLQVAEKKQTKNL